MSGRISEALIQKQRRQRQQVNLLHQHELQKLLGVHHLCLITLAGPNKQQHVFSIKPEEEKEAGTLENMTGQ